MRKERRQVLAIGVLASALIFLGLYQTFLGHLCPGDGLTGGGSIVFALILALPFSGSSFFDRENRWKLLAVAETAGALALLALAHVDLRSTLFYNALAGQGGLFGQSLPEGGNIGPFFSSGTIALINGAFALLVIGAFGRLTTTFFEASSSGKHRREGEGENA